MTNHRRAARIDENQPQIVRDLRKCGFSVEVDHDDILVGGYGRTFWYEIKGARALDKDGNIKESEIKPSQKTLRAEFKGHYKIVSSFDQIIEDMQNEIKGVKIDISRIHPAKRYKQKTIHQDSS